MSLQLPDFKQARVLVAGDVMLDRNWLGGTHRISPEAPVPVVRVAGDTDRPGGAANVAINIAALGAAVTLVGVVGDDEAGEALFNATAAAGVATKLIREPTIRTITKLRVVSRSQQLLRLDFEDESAGYNAESFTPTVLEALERCDVLVLSDYAKGALADPQPLINAARAKGIAVVIDPKGSDFSRYSGASLITPNMSEFEAVVGGCAADNDAEIEEKAKILAKTHSLDAVLVTRSEHGMSLVSQTNESLHLPTRALEVFDVTGAGDTVVATLASALAAGCDMAKAATLANLAAGLVVAKSGTASVSLAELQMAASPLVAYRGVMNAETLTAARAAASAAGERVVMTNGCFDILHAGHVSYLEQARALGDRLIVAVNSDESVARLKGPQRPMNSLEDRMAVLAGLASVDWVVPFADDTPAELIEQLLPDILVKGGDYVVEDIAGAPAVLANGGQVEILGFLDGRSTSRLIEQIRSTSDSAEPSS